MIRWKANIHQFDMMTSTRPILTLMVPGDTSIGDQFEEATLLSGFIFLLWVVKQVPVNLQQNKISSTSNAKFSKTYIVSGVPLHIGRPFCESMASERQRLHTAVWVSISQRIQYNVVPDWVVELFGRSSDKGSGSFVEQFPFSIIRFGIFEKQRALDACEKLRGCASPVQNDLVLAPLYNCTVKLTSVCSFLQHHE